MELLKMNRINKSFFGQRVLNHVSMEVGMGEVHALLGENGAGKSTLMNILAGVYEKDGGTIFFDARELTNSSVSEREEVGISFVHQELNIFNDLRVYENLFLGKEYVSKFGMLNKRAMIQETQDLMNSLGVDINPRDSADHIDTGKKQLLEIAKAFHADSKLIILDEPTTALNNNEIAKFFEIIRNMKKLGTSFIFISHKMPEIFEIADTYTVLRNGELVSAGQVKDTTPENIARDMVGSSYSNKKMYEKRTLHETVLELKNISGKGFSNIDFTIRKGEIVGFTGLKGAGCSEVLKVIFGVQKIEKGKMFVEGKEVDSNSIKTAMKNKVAMVPANRKENSVIQDMNIMENTYISQHCIDSKVQHIFKKQEVRRFEQYKDILDIKTQSPTDPMTSLSGGNQQKVILARWLNTEAEILLLDNPTQGIDVGAKSEIYRLILELSKQGKTIIVNTLEVPEIEKIADRCIVFYHGKIAAELEHSNINEESVMLYATNAMYAKEHNMEA